MQGKKGQRRPRRSAQEDEGRYRSLVENSLEGIGLIQDGKVLFANPALLKMYGYDCLEEVVGRPISDMVAPESRDYVVNLSRQREAGAEVSSHYEYRGLRRDGTLIDVEVLAVRIPYEGKSAVQATFRDVAEQKRLEAELKISTETLWRRNAQLAALNSAVRVMSGQLDMKELHTTFEAHIRGVIPFDHAAVSLLEDERHFRHLATDEVVTAPGPIGRAGSATDWVIQNRQPLIRKDILTDGRFRVSRRTRSTGIRSDILIPLVSRGRVVGTLSLASRDPGVYSEADLEFLQPLADQLAVSVDNARLYRDLSQAYDDLKAVQAQVVESEKLRALAEMAGGVAHNFNNLLTGILGYAQLLQMDSDATLYAHGLEVIERGAREGARIVREMQEFARAQSEQAFERTDLNRVVQRSVTATESIWRDKSASRGITVKLKTSLGSIPPVEGDEFALEKVVSNLIVNAVEAMPGGGTITVETGLAPDREIEGVGLPGITLSVSDTGMGMSAEERERIFQPFFTTKGPQIGHGLGLSVAYGIVLRHQGRIEVTSELAKGTTFTVWLPAAAQTLNGAGPLSTLPEDSARLLVIDDDGLTRDLLSRMFKMYNVDLAENGQQGLALFEKGRHEIVITDLGMPGLNGWDVARTVKRAASRTRVVLMTGWDVDIEDQQVRESGVDGLLRKPFDIRQVQVALAQAWQDRTGGDA
ncbi:MAG: PAS domain S-box protein [Candidatus Latescibacteria bacterium]|nr:PAS domain S-box protein [Candidatus Latescibacterota bacterium]